MDEERMELCNSCQNGIVTHIEGEIHEICKAGTCMLCFQSKKCECDSYKEKEN